MEGWGLHDEIFEKFLCHFWSMSGKVKFSFLSTCSKVKLASIE